MSAPLNLGKQPDVQLDLRGTPCPLNFVRTKLRLQRMKPGMVLEVWLDPGEPMEQVPEGLTTAGYPIEATRDCEGYVALRVRCPDLGQ